MCIFHQNEVFYITFYTGDHHCAHVIYSKLLEVDERQEKYIRTLLEYQEKLQQSNEERRNRPIRPKSEFLSHMSHDIRTAINGIMGMVEIIKKNLDDPERIKLSGKDR